jgi:YVTN family beta-propeller protein
MSHSALDPRATDRKNQAATRPTDIRDAPSHPELTGPLCFREPTNGAPTMRAKEKPFMNQDNRNWGSTTRALFMLGALGTSATIAPIGGCVAEHSQDPGVSPEALANRAYIISLESDELTVIDLDKLEIIGRVSTDGISNHMAELNADYTKIYVDSSDTDEAVVVDAKKLEVVKRIKVGKHPTHVSLSLDGALLAIMAEEEGTGAISFIDPALDVEVKRLEGFYTPHFMRFSTDGRFGYVANIGAHHLTRVDLKSLDIESHIPLTGFEGPPNVTLAPDEGGFADAQIAHDGTLYAAHSATGRVILYDTVKEQKLEEVPVGQNPWIVFAEHPFPQVTRRYLGPNFRDRTVSLIDGPKRAVVATLEGDSEAYGVNYTSREPDRAFVMNRIRQDIAVVDMAKGEITERIPVGGNTETASTTPDGRWIVATVSSANQVVVIDTVTKKVIKTFDDVGKYPWSVTIPGGQNYCH